LLVLFGLGAGLVWRHREVFAMATLSVLCGLYVLVVGGDWMPLYRYLAPVQPFLLLLVGLGARAVVEQRSRMINYGVLMLALISVGERSSKLNADRALIIRKEKRFWDTAAGGVARWFEEQQAERGRDAIYGAIALGDIGEIGYRTDMPILDLLGLVDPVIAGLPGGYTNKVGPGYRDRFFDYAPRYFVLISSNNDCVHPSVTGSRVLFNDGRFRQAYGVSGKVRLDGGFFWCIYENKSHLGPGAELPPAPSGPRLRMDKPPIRRPPRQIR
jgi:hypothetical protein